VSNIGSTGAAGEPDQLDDGVRVPLVTAIIPDTDVVPLLPEPLAAGEALAAVTGSIPVVAEPALAMPISSPTTGAIPLVPTIAGTTAGEITAPGAIPRSVQAAASWSWRLLLIGAFALAVGWLFSHLTPLIVPVAMALLVALLLLPVRNFFADKFHLSRKAAVAASILGSLVVIAALVWFAFRQVYAVLPDLAGQVVQGVNEIRNWIDQSSLNISNAQFDQAWAEIQSNITSTDNISTAISGALGAVGTIRHVFTGALLLVFCTIFFLADGRTIWTWVVNLLPVTAREKVHQAARRGAVTLSAYVRTQILVAAIDGVGIGLGMLFFVPSFALPIGVLVFIGSAIPVLGAIITGSIASIVVLVSRGWVMALIMLGIVLLVQQLESHILLPFLMGQAVSLHPVAVVLAVVGGSMVAGLAGALFAVPLVAMANTMVQYLFGVDKFPELGTMDHVPLLRRPKLEETFAVLQDSLRRVGRKQTHDDEASEGAVSTFELDVDDDDVIGGAGVVKEGEM